MQALVICSECGDSIRRDDGPLAPPSEQPKRILYTVGTGAVLTLDYCNGCFTKELETAQPFTRADLAGAKKPPPALKERT